MGQKKEDETEWHKSEDVFFNTLAQIMETDWPKNRKTIKAMVSIMPICPRFLETWSFTVCGLWRGKGVIEVIMHEICHFLYFKKWEEVFSVTDKEVFNGPRLEWHLSEILAPVILNDSRIQKILKKKPDFYEEHMKIKIGNKTAPEYFSQIYDQHLENKTSFEAFLRAAYHEIKKYKKLFNF